MMKKLSSDEGNSTDDKLADPEEGAQEMLNNSKVTNREKKSHTRVK